MSTVTQSLLVPPVQLAASDAAYYTSPSLTTAKIGRAVFFNSDTIPHVVTMNVTNGVSSAANEVLSRSIAPSESYVSPELAGQVLPAGYSLRGLADLAAKVTLLVSGLTIV